MRNFTQTNLRNTLLAATAVLSLASCQKDHYLDDLNAEKQITAGLTSQLNAANASLATMKADAAELSAVNADLNASILVAQSNVASLTSQIEVLDAQGLADEGTINGLQDAAVDAQLTISDLNAQEVVLTSSINTLQADLDAALASGTADDATIVSLTNSLADANASLASLRTQLSAANTEIARLNAIIVDLRAQLHLVSDHDSNGFTGAEDIMLEEAGFNSHHGGNGHLVWSKSFTIDGDPNAYQADITAFNGGFNVFDDDSGAKTYYTTFEEAFAALIAITG